MATLYLDLWGHSPFPQPHMQGMVKKAPHLVQLPEDLSIS